MYTLLVTGDVPGASTYFNPLVQQSIIPCTSGTRPTPSHEGMHIYETDTDQMAKWNGVAWEYVAGTRIDYTPTLSAVTTPPTMGTGNIRDGYYSRLPGSLIAYHFYIQFGTSGVAAGSGQYLVSLPVNAVAAGIGGSGQPAIGSAMIRDDSAGAIQAGHCYVPGTNLTSVAFYIENATTAHNVPWTWAANDYISGTIVYPY
jgi:hypothetical protein